MKRYVPKESEETTSEIGDICGFVDSNGWKGYLVYVGISDHKVHAINLITTMDTPNSSYGFVGDNTFSNIEDFIERGLQSSSNVSIIYFFDTQKELHKWLSED